MPRTAAIVIGHSHLSSIVLGLRDRAGETYSPNEGVEWFIFNTHSFGVDFQFSVPDATGNYILNPALTKVIDANVPENYNRIFVSMFGGNAHNALTLLEHPVPFDFVLPESPNRKRIEGTSYVPYYFVRDFLRRSAAAYLLNMATLRNAYSEAMVHIESPPPIGDSNYMLEHLEQYFKEQSRKPTIAPKELRYKLWRAHSNIVIEACRAHGVTFVDAPAESLDSEGFLVRPAYGSDSTHAGPLYGVMIMKQVEAIAGSRYGGWNWLG